MCGSCRPINRNSTDSSRKVSASQNPSVRSRDAGERIRPVRLPVYKPAATAASTPETPTRSAGTSPIPTPPADTRMNLRTPRLGRLGDTGRYLLASTLVIGLGLLIGYDPAGGLGGTLAAVALVLTFAFGMGWIWTTVGLVVRSPRAIMSIGVTVRSRSASRATRLYRNKG
jgi:hypothetical protein